MSAVNKQTFYDFVSQSYNGKLVMEEVHRLTGVSIERLCKIRECSVRLTKEEYEAFGRCPAMIMPISVMMEKMNEVNNKFDKDVIDVDNRELWSKMKASNWELMEEDDTLPKPANIMTAFIRIRPRRLMQAITSSKMLTEELEEFARKCYNPNFNKIRFTATVSYYLVAPEGPRKELKWYLEHGGFKMNGPEWIEAMKKHHAVVKATRFINHLQAQVSSYNMAEYLYFPSLAGRDHYITEEATLQQIKARTTKHPEYRAYNSTKEELRTFCINRWKDLMTNTDKIKRPLGWDEFCKMLYTKVPSGSTSIKADMKVDFNEIGGIRGLVTKINGALRGNKRMRAELKPIRHFSKFGKWLVGAFLKYEVAKNRWLYPADFEYIVLGLFIMDSIVDAFLQVSGVDLGHDLFGSISTKLDVVAELCRGSYCVNTDGKGFDEHHMFYDMETVYEMVRNVIDADKADKPIYQELMQAVDKYIESIKARDVKFPKVPGVTEERIVEVTDSLFSGEQFTSFVNTVWMGTAGMHVSESMSMDGLINYIKLFYKGDDLNAFTHCWFVCFILLKRMEACEFELEPAKDHIEVGQCEHERCIVTPSGYRGSLCRRVGSMVAAEPQGAMALTFEEAVTSANENRMSLICRGATVEGARVLMKATLMTYMDKDDIPRSFWRLLHIPKVNGGFGLWSTRALYKANKAPPPAVRTDFVMKKGGCMDEFGSAVMTDSYIKLLCDREGIDPQVLKEDRDKMVGDSFMVGLGPSKYGNRRYENVDILLARAASLKAQPLQCVTLNGEGNRLATAVSLEFGKLLSDTKQMRVKRYQRPSEVMADGLARSGMLNLEIYKKLKNIHNNLECYKLLVANPSSVESAEMISNLLKKGDKVFMAFVEGKVHGTFWSEGTPINSEVIALVASFVMHWVARTELDVGVNHTKDLNLLVKWDWVLTLVGKRILQDHGETLLKISF